MSRRTARRWSRILVSAFTWGLYRWALISGGVRLGEPLNADRRDDQCRDRHSPIVGFPISREISFLSTETGVSYVLNQGTVSCDCQNGPIPDEGDHG